VRRPGGREDQAPAGAAGPVPAKLLQQASARSLPDLALVDNPDLQQLAATGGLVSLSGRGEHRRPLPVDRRRRPVPGADLRDRAGVNGLALYYNKDLFTQAGLTPPKTWDS